jgi:cytochrome c-type biogenesis protein CcmH/NrfF
MSRVHSVMFAALIVVMPAALRAQNTPGVPDTGHATPQMQTSSEARAPSPVLVSRQDSVLEERTKAVAAQLRCPVCQGLSIQDSPSELARQMKSLVREQLAAGKTPDEIKAYYVSKYGSWILLEPPASGFSLLVYVLPAVALLGGALFVVFITRRWLHNPAKAPINDPDREVETSEV